MNRKAIATNTLKILEAGFFQIGDGIWDIRNTLEFAVQDTALFLGSEPELEFVGTGTCQTRIAVTNETSLEALARLARENTDEVLCLNFASAKNPGGGFLGGAQAQEESLARSSGLYPCLLAQPMFYEFHRKQQDLLYSHRMIYSPSIPVFKNDGGELFDPYNAAFITCAAPNAGAIASNQANSTPQIPKVLEQRAALVLGLAALKKHQRLVLGAWGCGVFRNDPKLVARVFKNLLGNQFKNVFEEVVFAVYDSSKDKSVFLAFESNFKECKS
jgi:uncharacterized protein (TIGR02452 family)